MPNIKRAFLVLVTAVLVASCSSGGSPRLGIGTPVQQFYVCRKIDGFQDGTPRQYPPASCPVHKGYPAPLYGDTIVSWTTTVYSSTSSTSTTVPPTTSTTTTFGLRRCFGVAMTAGQSDIDSHGTGTTFCISGTHSNWDLTPKTGDQFIGDPFNPGILDGGGTTQFAFEAGTADNVVIQGLEIRNYAPSAPLAAIMSSGSSAASGWILRDLQVHDSDFSGVILGINWKIVGGRYYNNRVQGITGSIPGTGALVDGVEVDHNNFTNDSYTTRNHDCADQGGGIKFFGNNTTIQNSNIHDNACVGVWSDGNAQNSVITNNQINNNWNEGVFIEISNGSTITGNTVTGNGLKGGGGSNTFGCTHWLYGGNITAASSANVTVSGNTVSGGCNGITGTQETRPDGDPGLLENFSVHNNTIAGPGGVSGVGSFPIVDLTSRNIVFANNTYSNGMNFCNFTCPSP